MTSPRAYHPRLVMEAANQETAGQTRVIPKFMIYRPLFAVAALLLSSYLAHAAPLVSNLTAVQGPGSELFEIRFDVSADTPMVHVTLEVSDDGGATYTVPTNSANGAVGSGITTGSGKAITWDAGADWDGKYSQKMLFRVQADNFPIDLIPVQAGALPASSWAGAQGVGAFSIGKTEITWAEWQAVSSWSATNGYDIDSAGAGNGPNHPVHSVTWYEVVKWCNAASEQVGLSPVYHVGGTVYRSGISVPIIDPAATGYRLPSEKEWEFAARGGVKGSGLEFSGSNNVDAVAWHEVNSGGTSHPVGSKQPNELGILDMSGNAWELCFDPYTSTHRVGRGGSWLYGINFCRVGQRGAADAGVRYIFYGFRVARRALSGAEAGGGFAVTGDVTVDNRSSVATLDTLVLSSGSLSPSFEPETASYTAAVSESVITLTPTASDEMATVKVLDVPVASGTPSTTIPLVLGNNTIQVEVTAEDGTTVTIYTLEVTYAPAAYKWFIVAETALPLADAGLVTLFPLERFSTVSGSAAHDGVAALKFTAEDNSSSYAERVVEGPSVVSFWWRVSSEKHFDFFSFSINGQLQEAISGDGKWLYKSFILGEGIHQLRWSYAKDEGDANFDDAGYLDEVVILEAYKELEVSSSGIPLDESASLDFGSVRQGATPPGQSIRLKNNGTLSMTVVATLPAASNFTFNNGQRTASFTLAVGAQTDLLLEMLTAAAGDHAAALTLSAPGSRTLPPEVVLRGLVEPNTPVIVCTWAGGALTSGQSAAVDFGAAAAELTFTVTNTGDASLTISAVTILPVGNFEVIRQPESPVVIGGSTTFAVRALDLQRGNHLATLTIASDAVNTPAFAIPIASQALLAVAGDGAIPGSVVTSGNIAGWGLAATALPDGSIGQAMMTGATQHNGSSTLGATFDGPGLLSWKWKVSTQQDFDWLVCEVDGTEVAGISTKTAAWQSQVVRIPEGAQVRWIYRKDGSNQSGTDSGHLADIRFNKFPTTGQLFDDWSDANGGLKSEDLIPAGGLQARFAWLGGVDPLAGPEAASYRPRLNGGDYFFRYSVSKIAASALQPQISTDMVTWDSRRMSQTLLSEDESRAVIELSVPATSRVFSRLITGYRPPPQMVFVAAGQWAGAAAFFIGKTEVTWAEWQTVRDWAAANGYDNGSDGLGAGPNHPVHTVNWIQAVKWCNAASEQAGLKPVYYVNGGIFRRGVLSNVSVDTAANGYRLPSLQEWYFAAIGGVQSKGYTYSGSNDANAVAWYGANSGGATHEVATKQPNELGLSDMSGNVWEWCFGEEGSFYRPMRGGSFAMAREDTKVTTYSETLPNLDNQYDYGLRVARSSFP